CICRAGSSIRSRSCATCGGSRSGSEPGCERPRGARRIRSEGRSGASRSSRPRQATCQTPRLATVPPPMAATNGSFDLKHRSRALTEGPERAPARAYLKGIGFDEEALSKPIVAVANTWIETMPCNFHLRALAAKVKDGIREAGGTPMELNTIAISDGITM